MTGDAPALLRRFLLIGLCVALVLIGLLLVLTSGRDSADVVRTFADHFLRGFLEAAPFLLLGVLAGGLIDSFIHPDDLARIIPRSRFGGVAVGSVMGFIFPVCEYGVVPVVRRLYSKGLPVSAGVTFLLAAPVINPIVIVSTYVAFGFGPLLIGRIVITLVAAVIVGLIFALAARPTEVLRPSALPPVPDASPASGRKSLGAGLRDALTTAAKDFFDLGRYLLLGSLIAAAMQTLIAHGWLTVTGGGPVMSVIVMMALAFVLGASSTGDVLPALAFANTFAPGAILAFLTFGPMVDIKSALMYAGVYKPRTVLYLIVLPFLLILLICVWLNLNVVIS